jgi:hypothetical protein
MNPIKGEIVLRLGKEKYLLVLDNAGLVEASVAYTGKANKLRKLFADLQPEEDEDGEPVFDEDGDPIKDTLPATRALLFGALQAHHSDLSMRDVTNMLVGHAGEIAVALEESLRASHPELSEGEGKDDKNPPTKPRGRNSGRSGAKRA